MTYQEMEARDVRRKLLGIVVCRYCPSEIRKGELHYMRDTFPTCVVCPACKARMSHMYKFIEVKP